MCRILILIGGGGGGLQPLLALAEAASLLLDPSVLARARSTSRRLQAADPVAAACGMIIETALRR